MMDKSNTTRSQPPDHRDSEPDTKEASKDRERTERCKQKLDETNGLQHGELRRRWQRWREENVRNP